ncbi:hypothetical protein L6452_30633 [Arctium lappa]|uniref:Uncharacterized protein n=1 Tax=Arctium lappa TaxID=4217 RepID=A0ACB8ZN33_ARCLA|nr:hypothetical protein L6452_30633 [Arctium lappa]
MNNRLSLLMKSGKQTLGYKTVLEFLGNSKGGLKFRLACLWFWLSKCKRYKRLRNAKDMRDEKPVKKQCLLVI